MTDITPKDQEIAQPRGLLTADFLLESDRISGQVNVRARPLIDQLDDTTSSFLDLEDVYLSPITRPSELNQGFPAATLRKTAIHAAVLTRFEDGLSRHQAYGSYLGNIPHDVLLITSRYQVRGRVLLPPKMQLQTVIVAGTTRFLLVSEATVTLTEHPEISFAGGAILVNMEQVTAFCEINETHSS